MKSNITKLAAPTASSCNKRISPKKPVRSPKYARKSAGILAQQEISKLAALFAAERYTEAATLAHTITKRAPSSGFGWKALGVALKQLGHSAAALTPMQKAAELLSNDAEAYNNLGALLYELGMLDLATISCQQALRINPNYPEAYCNLGIVFKVLGQLNEAEACYGRALTINPKSVEALHGLGDLHLENGDAEKAEKLYRQALLIKPSSMAVRYSLSFSRQENTQDENFAALIEIAKAVQNHTVTLSTREMIYLHFALGICFEQNEDYAQAFPHFQAGCKLKRTTLNYASDRSAEQFSKLIEIFDKHTIERLRGAGDPSDLPIFILGMPRSGTTLVEQIIASHPAVYGAGELPDLMSITRQNTTNSAVQIAFPDNLRSLDQATLDTWGEQYVAGLKPRAFTAQHITDKMPENFFAVGLI
ncbi:MAG: tetratricopeptide repeat protein, partial [Burkholderiales bacterium]|nr:tetratricopeptide repeat protein [Burkholderiales bacterium]